MTQLQKFAALLILLGEDIARLMLQHFDDRESELLATEIASLPLIVLEQQTEVLKEFTEWALQANAALGGSVEYTRAVLEKTFGLWKAAEIIGRIAPEQASAVVMPLPPPKPTSTRTLQRIVDGLRSAKSKLDLDFGLGSAAPARITIEVLKQLTRENPLKMSQAARLWANGPIEKSETKREAQTSPLSQVQKLAALLILLGEDTASIILKHLGDREGERIAMEMARLPILNLEEQTAVLREFTEMALTAHDDPVNLSDVAVMERSSAVAQPGVEAQGTPEEHELEELQAAKSKLVMDFGLGQQAPERITIEVLKELIRENPAKMSQVARRWLSGTMPET